MDYNAFLLWLKDSPDLVKYILDIAQPMRWLACETLHDLRLRAAPSLDTCEILQTGGNKQVPSCINAEEILLAKAAETGTLPLCSPRKSVKRPVCGSCSSRSEDHVYLFEKYRDFATTRGCCNCNKRGQLSMVEAGNATVRVTAICNHGLLYLMDKTGQTMLGK